MAKKKLYKIASEASSDSDTPEGAEPISPRLKGLIKALKPYMEGKSRASKLRSIPFGPSLGRKLHILCAQDRCVQTESLLHFCLCLLFLQRSI